MSELLSFIQIDYTAPLLFLVVFGLFLIYPRISAWTQTHPKQQRIYTVSVWAFVCGIIVIALTQAMARFAPTILPNLISGIQGYTELLIVVTTLFGASVIMSAQEEKTSETEANDRSVWTYIIFALLALFALVKVLIPYIYTGSFIDEHLHTLTAVQLLEQQTFLQVHHGFDYLRGLPISLLLTTLFTLFGKSLYIAKLLPASIGIINAFLLYRASKHVIKKKPYIALLLVLYTIGPFVLLNHFYIRFYILYEMYLLLFVNLFISIVQAIDAKKKAQFWVQTTLTLFLIFGVVAASHDLGRFVFIAMVIFFYVYLLIFHLNKIEAKAMLADGTIELKTLHFSKLQKILALCVVGAILAYFLYHTGLAQKFFAQTIIYTNTAAYKYHALFTMRHALFVIFFVLSLLTYRLSEKNKNVSVLFVTITALFFSHFVMPKSFQLTRTIMYIFPVFFLFAVTTLAYLPVTKKCRIPIIAALLLAVITSYPEQFVSRPQITSELHYKETTKAVELVSSLRTPDTDAIILTPLPTALRLSMPDVTMYAITDTRVPQRDALLHKDPVTKTLRFTATGDEAIRSTEKLRTVIDTANEGGKEVFYILDTDLWGFLTVSSHKLMRADFERVEKLGYLEVWKQKGR